MKNKIFKYVDTLLILLMVLSINGCQDLNEPELGNYPLDGPVLTLTSPNPNGLTIIQSVDPIASITIKFTAQDDIEISNILVTIDGNEVANMNSFEDPTFVQVDDLVYDNVDVGEHSFNLTATDSDGNIETITTTFIKEDTPPYEAILGEVLYMNFDGNYTDQVSNTDATVVGTPGFAGEAKVGTNSYAGATDSYLTFPTDGLLGSEFSASFWLNINNVPDRAGILVIGPPDAANPDAQNNRTSGFRFFRENGANGDQRFKLNVGNGTADSWFDGGATADVTPNTGEWTNFAFTISGTECVVYINGEVVKQGSFSGVDWTGCDVLSIMSGAPRFTGWSHFSDLSYMDELRIYDTALTQEQVYKQLALGSQKLYMPFNGTYMDKVTDTDATIVGTPGYSGGNFDGGVGDSYAGAADSYLTFPTDGLMSNEFSASFWMNINNVPDRAGILIMGPEDTANPDAQNNRTSGFRFFRENGADGNQRFKLNAGNGTADSWFDGGTAADVAPNTGNWDHFAFTISDTECVVYVNGNVVKQGAFTGIDWTGCDVLSIMSGAPRFTGWSHFSDLSFMDDLRIFDKALSQGEVLSLMN